MSSRQCYGKRREEYSPFCTTWKESDHDGKFDKFFDKSNYDRCTPKRSITKSDYKDYCRYKRKYGDDYVPSFKRWFARKCAMKYDLSKQCETPYDYCGSNRRLTVHPVKKCTKKRWRKRILYKILNVRLNPLSDRGTKFCVDISNCNWVLHLTNAVKSIVLTKCNVPSSYWNGPGYLFSLYKDDKQLTTTSHALKELCNLSFVTYRFDNMCLSSFHPCALPIPLPEAFSCYDPTKMMLCEDFSKNLSNRWVKRLKDKLLRGRAPLDNVFQSACNKLAIGDLIQDHVEDVNEQAKMYNYSSFDDFCSLFNNSVDKTIKRMSDAVTGFVKTFVSDDLNMAMWKENAAIETKKARIDQKIKSINDALKSHGDVEEVASSLKAAKSVMMNEKQTLETNGMDIASSLMTALDNYFSKHTETLKTGLNDAFHAGNNLSVDVSPTPVKSKLQEDDDYFHDTTQIKASVPKGTLIYDQEALSDEDDETEIVKEKLTFKPSDSIKIAAPLPSLIDDVVIPTKSKLDDNIIRNLPKTIVKRPAPPAQVEITKKENKIPADDVNLNITEALPVFKDTEITITSTPLVGVKCGSEKKTVSLEKKQRMPIITPEISQNVVKPKLEAMKEESKPLPHKQRPKLPQNKEQKSQKMVENEPPSLIIKPHLQRKTYVADTRATSTKTMPDLIDNDDISYVKSTNEPETKTNESLIGKKITVVTEDLSKYRVSDEKLKTFDNYVDGALMYKFYHNPSEDYATQQNRLLTDLKINSRLNAMCPHYTRTCYVTDPAKSISPVKYEFTISPNVHGGRRYVDVLEVKMNDGMPENIEGKLVILDPTDKSTTFKIKRKGDDNSPVITGKSMLLKATNTNARSDTKVFGYLSVKEEKVNDLLKLIDDARCSK